MTMAEEKSLQSAGLERHEPLSTHPTTASEKQSDLEWEAESIASALGGGDSVHEHDVAPAEDLEKATTQATDTNHEPATRYRTAIDWEPNDPENPQLWSFGKKAYHTFATGFLAFAVTVGSSLITPATPEIAEHFGVSRTAAILSLTLYVLGLALGPVIAAPISETYGRSVVYKTTPLLFMPFVLGAGFSKSFGSLLVCRLLAGIAGAPVLAVGAGTNADMYPIQFRAIASSSFIMMPFLGPALGPVIGGFVAQYKGWRWTQWVTIFIALTSYIVLLPMQETYKKVILSKRAKKYGIEGPPKPPVKGLGYVKLLITVTLIRPVNMLVTEPIVLFLSLYSAFTFSVLFAYFAAYPFVFESVYGFTTSQYGLTFLGLMVGVFCSVATVILCDRKIYLKLYARQVTKEGRVAVRPEHRLYPAMMGSFGITIGLFWFAWTARRDIHWIVPTLAGIPFAWGNLSIFVSTALYLIDVYGAMNGASALAANGLARYGMGAVFPLFTFQMYQRLGIDWATSLLGFLSVAMLPIPWVFYKFGPKIRAKSNYDTLKI